MSTDKRTTGKASAANQTEQPVATDQADNVTKFEQSDHAADGDAAALREEFPLDADAEAAYPVENGATRWEDAPNGGDTAPEATGTYATPWGRRPMTHREVADLAQQGVVCTPVDDVPETSLQREKDDMSHVSFKGSDDPSNAGPR